MNIVTSLKNKEKQKEIQVLFQQIMDSGYYSEGEQTELAEFGVGKVLSKKAVLFNSCGSALFACYQAYKNRGHKRVVIQNNTFYATASTAVEAGLEIVLCDNRSDCPSMSLDSLKEALDRVPSKLVALTHVGGWVAKDYKKIVDFCQQENIELLEDCAHCFNVEEAGKYGTACWSFYPTKSTPIGEGGAVTSNNEGLLQFVSRYRSYGKYYLKNVIYYDSGMNLRISEWDAAVLRVQLRYLKEIQKSREADAQKLQSIAECKLDGPTNWYKFPVDSKYEEEFKTVGKVYQRSDQLDKIFKLDFLGSTCLKPVPLINSVSWAHDHCCLPLGEGIFQGLSVEEVKEILSLKEASN